ncbi:glycosyltransferase [Sphingomonas floccifaciens]|uniref:Glycosyltransferase n=1 Tax=Sphingomonas floccifaciens TaxID=1844115 RepID=A0ABW4N846_9SPHN
MTLSPTARHILTYAHNLDGGGVERVLLRLIATWIARGRRVTLVVGCDAGPLAAEIGRDVEVIRLKSREYLALATAMPAIVRDTRPDVIFCPGNHYTAVAAWTRLRLGRACPPTIAKLSNALDRTDLRAPVRAAYALWLGCHARFVDTLVAMSPAMAREAALRMRLPDARVRVIPNPAPEPESQGAGATGPDLPDRYLLGVGRLAPQKRWDRAVDMLARIDDPTIPLVILGEGEERAALVAQAEALGVGDRLLMPGHVTDPLPAMADATAVVLTSDYEGVPGVVREALAVGAPVVATDSTPALGELLVDDAQGSIVARDDEAALVAAVEARLAPGAPRPAPVAATGDPAGDYLALFDSLVSSSV